MKVGNLVIPKEEFATDCWDYGVGTILERYEYPEDDLAGPVSYKVQWRHEFEFWKEEELILVAE